MTVAKSVSSDVHNRIRYPDVARKVQQALDIHPAAPPKQYGRLRWFADQFQTRFGQKVSNEQVRKWLDGINEPSPENRARLAEILQVDPTWLVPGLPGSEKAAAKAAHNADAGAGVNLIASLVQMDGGAVAVPEADSPRSPDVDLVAIIRGAQYHIHVSTAEHREDGQWWVPTTTTARDLIFLAVVRNEGFSFDVLEVTADDIEDGRVRDQRSYGLWINRRKDAYFAGTRKLRQITSFANRL